MIAGNIPCTHREETELPETCHSYAVRVQTVLTKGQRDGLRALLAWARFPAPLLGGTQPPVTVIPGNIVTSVGTARICYNCLQAKHSYITINM